MNLHLAKDKSNAMLTWRAGRTDVLEYLQFDVPCNLGFDGLRNAERWRFFGFACLHLTVNFNSRRWRRGNIAPACVFRQTGSRIDSCELRRGVLPEAAPVDEAQQLDLCIDAVEEADRFAPPVEEAQVWAQAEAMKIEADQKDPQLTRT